MKQGAVKLQLLDHRDIGSSSHRGLIVVPGQEANGDDSLL